MDRKEINVPVVLFQQTALTFSVLKQVTPTEKRVLLICKED